VAPYLSTIDFEIKDATERADRYLDEACRRIDNRLGAGTALGNPRLVSCYLQLMMIRIRQRLPGEGV
jgi:hypothetical protein